MGSKLFKEGGPHKIKKTGPDEYQFRITIPEDEKGCIARECSDENCSPGYFKVKLGTGITSEQEQAYCPYCRVADDPNNFATKEQARYAHDVMLDEAAKGFDRMLSDALSPLKRRRSSRDLISIDVTYKSKPRKSVRRPYEDEVRRDITCPHCSLEHAVYGLATWCPDCGGDVFISHVHAEFEVIKQMLSDVDRRQGLFGGRIASKDLESCLEDIVSIFEATLKIIAKRHMVNKNYADDEIDKIFKKIGNSFQNIRRADKVFMEFFELSILQGFPDDDIERMADVFAKRHPITHNLGVIDKNYMEKIMAEENEGKEILVTNEELDFLIKISIYCVFLRS